jgi:hypothetical protein
MILKIIILVTLVIIWSVSLSRLREIKKEKMSTLYFQVDENRRSFFFWTMTIINILYIGILLYKKIM